MLLRSSSALEGVQLLRTEAVLLQQPAGAAQSSRHRPGAFALPWDPRNQPFTGMFESEPSFLFCP